MDRDAKIYGAGITIIVALFLASRSLNIGDGVNDLFVVIAAVSGIALAGKFVRDYKILDKINQQKRNGGRGPNYNIQECAEIVNEWAKEQWSHRIDQKKGISFDWTQSSSDPAQVYDFETKEWFWVRYFYTPYGPKEKATLIFVDANQGEVMTPIPVDKHDMKDDPYMYLEQYRMTRRNQHLISRGDYDENSKEFVPVSGIPMYNGGQRPPKEGGD